MSQRGDAHARNEQKQENAMMAKSSKYVLRQPFWVALTAFLALVYSLVVRDLRAEHKNAALGILISVGQPLVMGLVFYAVMELLGGGMNKLRGDTLTFVLVGFACFFAHIRSVSAVGGALKLDMLKHQRLSLFLMIWVKAFGALYKTILTVVILVALNYLVRDVYEMQDMLLFIWAFLWCWLGGVGVGVVFLAATRYLTWGGLLQTAYIRVMFFTSGKFFVASSLPGYTRPYMDWNPLFHLLDQARDATFLNYTARTTDLWYAVGVYCAILVLAALLENYVRVNFSASHAPS